MPHVNRVYKKNDRCPKCQRVGSICEGNDAANGERRRYCYARDCDYDVHVPSLLTQKPQQIGLFQKV